MCYLRGVGDICFFKQKTAYEMRISDWSSDVCSSDLVEIGRDRLRRSGGGVDPRDTVVVFRRAAGRLVAQIVGTAAGMGFQIRPRRIRAPQCAQQATQQHVFVDVGKVAGMKAMLVVHAALSRAALATALRVYSQRGR